MALQDWATLDRKFFNGMPKGTLGYVSASGAGEAMNGGIAIPDLIPQANAIFYGRIWLAFQTDAGTDAGVDATTGFTANSYVDFVNVTPTFDTNDNIRLAGRFAGPQNTNLASKLVSANWSGQAFWSALGWSNSGSFEGQAEQLTTFMNLLRISYAAGPLTGTLKLEKIYAMLIPKMAI